MYEVNFTPKGEQDLEKLSKEARSRVIKKLAFYSDQPDPLQFSKPLINLPPATHRFRVGSYRISFYVEGRIIFIARIRHRREIYR